MRTSSILSISPSRKARGIKASHVFPLLLWAAFSMPTGSAQAAGIDYSTTIQPIYNSSCIECHPSDGGMNLTSGVSYADTVNVTASNTGRAPYRVRPDEISNSAIWVIANAGGHNGATVTGAQLASITDWINQGALPDLSAPTVASVAPSSGGTAGGTAVTIMGAKFGGIGAFVPTVTFDGVPATNVVVTPGSFTEITCTTPAHAAGAVDVVVTTTAGGASAPLISGFTYTGLPTPTPTPTPTPSPTPTPGPTPTTLGNISTRLSVQTGDNVLIGGFIITGTQPKKVILRAIGPSLANANPPVVGALADPELTLNSGGTVLATNDNWMDAPNKQEIIDSTLAPTDNAESAILMTLNPGAYTAILEGVNNTTGVALVEAYDLDTLVDSKLANISTRGLVQTGDNVMIGGFIVLGTNSQKVIVRAIGPSLANANPPVPGAMADPTLELHNADGSILASNDNWRTTQEAEIIATGVPPTDDAESAIVATLAPNAYTAVLQGVNGTTGVALVEVYALGP